MKLNDDLVNKEWLTRPTGDPFADTGGYVIKYLWKQYPEKDILELIEYMAKIYVNRWGGSINAFFLNSKITQPAFKGEKKITETLKYFSSLINETEESESGYCRISGRKTRVFKAGRDNSLLSGSGTFVNFHHFFQSGIMLSKEMIIRMFFVPYGSVSVGGRIAIIHSNDLAVNEFFVYKNCKNNDNNLGMGLSEAVLKSKYGMPANALFQFVDDIFMDLDCGDKEISLTLYHFSNFGASPEIVIYTLPATVFRFYTRCLSPKLKQDWHRFLRTYYTNSKYKGALYNPETSLIEHTKKGDTERIGADEFGTWKNVILEKLLHGRTILSKFLDFVKKHRLNFRIVELYQNLIRNMKPETLEKIKVLATFLTSGDESKIKKNIRALDGAKNAFELRRFLLKKAVVENYNNGAEQPIITVDELVNYLFPDDVVWKEIRDVLLVAIYEKLHEKKIEFSEMPITDDINENEE